MANAEHTSAASLPDPAPLQLLAAQIDIPATRDITARRNHVARLHDLLDAALSERPADVVVLPELSTLEYSAASFAQLSTLAEPANGESHEVFSSLARKHACAVVYGYARRIDEPVNRVGDTRCSYRIAQQVILPGGAYADYNKISLAQFGDSMEKRFFGAGEQLLVFESGGWRIGVLICYDLRFDALTTALAKRHHCDVILHCGAYARDLSFATREPFVITRAMEHQIYWLALNRAGAHFGESLWVTPWVDAENPVQRFDSAAEQLRYFTADRSVITRVRDQLGWAADAERLSQLSLSAVCLQE